MRTKDSISLEQVYASLYQTNQPILNEGTEYSSADKDDEDGDEDEDEESGEDSGGSTSSDSTGVGTNTESITIPVSLFNTLRSLLLAEAKKMGKCPKCACPIGNPKKGCKCKHHNKE